MEPEIKYMKAAHAGGKESRKIRRSSYWLRDCAE